MANAQINMIAQAKGHTRSRKKLTVTKKITKRQSLIWQRGFIPNLHISKLRLKISSEMLQDFKKSLMKIIRNLKVH